MTDEFKLPSKSNLLRLNKTQRGSKNAIKIEKEIEKFIKDMLGEVDKEGKVAVERVTPYIGTPSAGYFTCEITVRMTWPKRRVPGVSNDEKKILITTGVKFENQIEPSDKYNKDFFSEFIVDPKTGKDINHGLAETVSVIEDAFAEYVDKIWPEKPRKDKYRPPVGEHRQPISEVKDNTGLIANTLANNINDFVSDLKNKAGGNAGAQSKDRITFTSGNSETGYFKIVSEISMQTTGLKKEASAIKINIVSDIWFRDNKINARSVNFELEYDISKDLKKSDFAQYAKDLNAEYEIQKDLSLKMAIRTLQERYLRLLS